MIQIDGYSHEWERRAVTDGAGRMVWLYRVGATDWHTPAPMCKAVRSE